MKISAFSLSILLIVTLKLAKVCATCQLAPLPSTTTVCEVEKELNDKLKKLKDHSNRTKNLIITVGPPASGKTSAVDNVQNQAYLGLFDPSLEPRKIIVDDIVSSFPEFQQEIGHVKTILLKALDIKPEKVENLTEEELNELAKKLTPAAADLVCAASTSVYYSNCSWADAKSSSLLLEAILSDTPHDIIYEATGNDGSMPWVKQVADLGKKYGYHTVVIYPVAPLDELISRSRQRAIKGEGRLPCEDNIKATAEQAQAQLITLMNEVTKGNSPIDYVFVVDKGGHKGQVATKLESGQQLEYICNNALKVNAEFYKKLPGYTCG